MKYRISLLFVFLLMLTLCRADKLVLTNGDRITGELDSLQDGDLKFKSELIGEITIDIANVKTFSTSEPAEIHLSDGTVIKQRVISDKAGRISVTQDGLAEAKSFDIADVASVNPRKKKAKWKGSISAGLSSSHGNTSTETRNLSLDLSRRGQNDRITLKADYARGKQEDPDTGEDEVTENWWRTRAKYDYFLTKKSYVYGQGRYEKDSIADLDRRIIIGGGTGYQWIESDAMNFSTEIGLASMYEKFDDQTGSNNEVSAELSYSFDKKFWKEFKFINDLSYYPSLEEPSDYLLSSTAEIRASITENMFSNFRVIFDYDSNPAEDADKTDVKYILGVGWNF